MRLCGKLHGAGAALSQWSEGSVLRAFPKQEALRVVDGAKVE